MDEFRSLITPDTRIKVSSTLDKSVGKKHLIDGSPETCWTSLQGLPQYIQLTFPSPVIPKTVSITFQGGFVGTCCSLQVLISNLEEKQWHSLTQIYPEDVNRRQTFDIVPMQHTILGDGVDTLRFVFEESSDLFGRITVYDLKIDGILFA